MWRVDHDFLRENFKSARFRKSPTLILSSLEYNEYWNRAEYSLKVISDEPEEEPSVPNRSALNALFMRIATPKDKGPFDVGYLVETDCTDIFDLARQENDTPRTNPNLVVLKTGYAEMLRYMETISISLDAEERFYAHKIVPFRTMPSQPF